MKTSSYLQIPPKLTRKCCIILVIFLFTRKVEKHIKISSNENNLNYNNAFCYALL